MNNPKAARRSRGRSQNRNNAPSGRRNGADGNRTEQRVKGNPMQLVDKYKSLARDALSAGDRVLAENYFQHADHYYRLMNDKNNNRQQQNADPQVDRDGARHDIPDNIGNKAAHDGEPKRKKIRSAGNKAAPAEQEDEEEFLPNGRAGHVQKEDLAGQGELLPAVQIADAAGETAAAGDTADEERPRRRRRTSPAAPRPRRKPRTDAAEPNSSEEVPV